MPSRVRVRAPRAVSPRSTPHRITQAPARGFISGQNHRIESRRVGSDATRLSRNWLLTAAYSPITFSGSVISSASRRIGSAQWTSGSGSGNMRSPRDRHVLGHSSASLTRTSSGNSWQSCHRRSVASALHPAIERRRTASPSATNETTSQMESQTTFNAGCFWGSHRSGGHPATN